MKHVKKQLCALLALCVAACSGGAEQFETQTPAVEGGQQMNDDPSTDASSSANRKVTAEAGSDVGSPESKRETAPRPKSDARVASMSASAGSLAGGESAGTDASARAAEPTLTRVELRFVDASTPPEYHRSYTINVEAGKVSTKIDVYGDIIASDVAEVSERAWVELGKRIPSQTPQPDDDPEATGGSAYFLKIWQGAEEHDFSWSAQTPRDATSKAVAAFASRVEALVPNLQQLRDTEYVETE